MNDTKGMDNLAIAVRRIAHGDQHGPAGLELVSMALADKDDNVTNGLYAIASALERLASAVEHMAEKQRPE